MKKPKTQTADKIWVGLKRGKYTVFYAATQPTESSHGHLYGAVIGPFRTARGAHFLAKYGRGNPHIQSVADAERLAKAEAKRAMASLQSTHSAMNKMPGRITDPADDSLDAP